MLEFRTLGSVDLRGEDGCRVESVLLHSKRLALLAYLCAFHPPKLHRRDTLVALLWPDLDEVHARGALRQELYRLRRALGPGLVTGEGGAVIGTDPERLWCDVRAFEEAVQSGRHADALELWGGEFLPGLHVKGGEFEGWVEQTRVRLRHGAMEAARRLSEAAEGGGDLPGAIAGARRLTELAPYDETGWQRLMLLLDREGDRAGALKAFASMAGRLRQELEVEPSPETRALMVRIRDRDRAVDPGLFPRPLKRAPRTAQRALIRLERVANRTGDPALDALGRRVADRLAHGVAGQSFIELVSGEDERVVTAVVSAVLYRKGGQIEIVPRLARPGPEDRLIEMPRSVLISPDDDVAAALETVTAHVLASLAAHYDPRFDIGTAREDTLAIATPLWGAYLGWLRGSELFGQSRFAEAYPHLIRAYEIDPHFTKTGIMAAAALAASGDPVAGEALLTDVMAAGEPLSDYDRTSVEWILANLHGRRAEAYQAAVEGTMVSTSVPAIYAAGMEAAGLNRPREALRRLEGFDPSDGWWRYMTEYYETVGGAHHVLGNHTAELAAALEGRRRFPASLEVIRAEVRARAALGQADQTLGLLDEALILAGGGCSAADDIRHGARTGPGRHTDVAWVAAQELDAHGHCAAAVRARRTALEWLRQCVQPSRPERQLQVRLLLETGDVAGAASTLQELAPFGDLESLALAGLVAAHAGDRAAARQVLAQLEEMRNPYLGGRHLLAAAGIRAVLDPPEVALAALRRALAEGVPFGVELHALPVLQPLASDPEFQALLHPRG